MSTTLTVNNDSFIQEYIQRTATPLEKLSQANAYKDSLVQLIKSIGKDECPISVTLSFNISHRISRDGGRKQLRHWDAMINKRLFGKNWYKQHNLLWIGMQEKWETNPHYHLLVAVPDEKLDKFYEAAPLFWRKTVPSGTAMLDVNPNWADYITKENRSIDKFILSTEFKSRTL